MALHGVADLAVQAVQIVSFSEDPPPESGSRIAALGGLLDKEDELAHGSPIINGCWPAQESRRLWGRPVPITPIILDGKRRSKPPPLVRRHRGAGASRMRPRSCSARPCARRNRAAMSVASGMGAPATGSALL